MSNSSQRLAGQLPESPTTLTSRFRLCGFLRNPSTSFSRATSINSRASSTAEWESRICSMSWSLSGSRRSTLTWVSGDTLVRLATSLAPSQSASRQDRRKRGFPSLSSCLRIASNGVRTSPAPARTSSSPSMKSVLPCHSGWDCTSKVSKSRAVTKQAPSRDTPHSASNAVLLPAPGSPSSTYAAFSRKDSRGRDLGVCAAERSWDLVVVNCSRPVPQEGSVVGKDVVFCSVLGHLVGFSARDFSCGADS